MIRGLDVSNQQGVIDWQGVSQDGYAFAFVKFTEGSDYYDEYHYDNVENARKNGLFVGGYHFFNDEDPIKQADHFLNEYLPIRKEFGPIIAAVDVEFAVPNLYNAVKAFVDRVQSLADVWPLVYCNLDFIDNHGLSQIGQCGLWLADWTTSLDLPETPKGWPFIAFWQCDANSRVTGISGPVDTDYFNGTVERIALYANAS